MTVDKIFEALSSAPRRRILAYLSKTDMTAGEIVQRFAAMMSQPAISKHLSVLENAGLVWAGETRTKRSLRTETGRACRHACALPRRGVPALGARSARTAQTPPGARRARNPAEVGVSWSRIPSSDLAPRIPRTPYSRSARTRSPQARSGGRRSRATQGVVGSGMTFSEH